MTAANAQMDVDELAQRSGGTTGNDAISDPQARWYVVYTRPRDEVRARENLRAQGFHAWLPMLSQRRRRSSGYQDVIAPMFPRYCFLFANAQQQSLGVIRSTRGCSDLVRFNGSPAIVPHNVVDELQHRGSEDGVLTSHDCEWREGQELEITEGPFAGLKAIFQARSSRERADVLIQWLGAWQRATVPPSQLVQVS